MATTLLQVTVSAVKNIIFQLAHSTLFACFTRTVNPLPLPKELAVRCKCNHGGHGMSSGKIQLCTIKLGKTNNVKVM